MNILKNKNRVVFLIKNDIMKSIINLILYFIEKYYFFHYFLIKLFKNVKYKEEKRKNRGNFEN